MARLKHLAAAAGLSAHQICLCSETCLGPCRSKAPGDGGLSLIITEHNKMHGKHEPNAALFVVTDQHMPAKHGIPNVAVLSSYGEGAKHIMYHPVVVFVRLLRDLEQECLGASLPAVPGVTVRNCPWWRCILT